MTGLPTPSRSAASSPTRKRFALAGRSQTIDPRVDAARGDLADIRLAHRLFAPHYAAAQLRSATHRAPLLAALGGEPISEILAGEDFDVLELAHDHAWGVSTADGAVGYVSLEALGERRTPTHIVCVPKTDAMDGSRLPMGSRVEFGTVDEAAVRPLGAPSADYVAAAESLVGTPHAMGGRSGTGVDAAGLVVLALSLTGIAAPRFSDLQAAVLGHPVADEAPMLRGDLLFFTDHVAIVAAADAAIHVTASGVVRAAIDDIVGVFGAPQIRRRLP